MSANEEVMDQVAKGGTEAQVLEPVDEYVRDDSPDCSCTAACLCSFYVMVQAKVERQ